VGAVVIGGDYNGLGVVRSLGRHGVPVCLVDDEPSISQYSRYTTYRVRVGPLRDDASIVASLLRTGDQFDLEGWVLYPTRDEVVAAIARNRAVLVDRFRVPLPDWSIVRWACDKRNTYQRAGELGVPTPRTWYPRDAADLSEIDCDPPFVLKPAIKENFIYATKAKAWRADSKGELASRFVEAARLVGEGEIMVQELIPGDGRFQFAYCAFFKNGVGVATMVTRRRRQHPPEFGRASTFVETIEQPLLEALSERFLREIDYYGLAELEYKLDSRTGEYKLLDFNARAWGYNSLGPRAGADLAHALFADAIGRPLAPQRARSGVYWIRLLTDLPTGVVEIGRGTLRWRTYLRSLLSVDVESVYSIDDLVPALAELALVPHLIRTRGF